MCRYRRNITYRGEYILGTDYRDFQNIFIRDLMVYKNHWMILAPLKGDRIMRNHMYCKGRPTWSIVTPKGVPI